MMKKIAIIDDEVVIRDLVKDVLSEQGHQVICADNGNHGITMVREELPDLIILDINMPEINGCAASSIIRSNEKTAHIPIVFLTGYIDEDEAKELDHHLGEYVLLTKPFTPHELIDTVNKAFNG